MLEFNDTYWPLLTREVANSVVLATFVQDENCPTPILELSQKDCIGDHDVPPIYFKPTFRPAEYENNEEVEPDGFGGEKLILRRVERIFPVITYCDRGFLKYFYESIYSSEHMDLRIIDDNLPGTDTIEIYSVSVEHREIGENLFEVTFRYKTSDVASHGPFGLKSCCNSLYDEAPYEDPCPEGGDGGGGGGSDPECVDAVVTVERVGDDLNASVTGYAGSYHFNWLFKENAGDPWTTLIQNATSVQLSDPGTYRAVLIAAGCNDKYDQYEYLGECHGFGVELRKEDGAIIADPSGGCAGGNYDYFLYNDGTGQFDPIPHNGDQTYVPAEDGLYKVEYSCDNNGTMCTDEDVILFEFNQETDCDEIDLGIEKDGEDMVPTGLVDPPDSFEWFHNDGAGEELIGVTETVSYQGEGLYLLRIMIGDCEYNAAKLILEDCDPCMGITAEIVLNESDNLQVNVEGCNGDLQVDWFRNQGAGYEQVGSGVEHTPADNALFRADIQCGDCTIQTYYMVCDGESGPVAGDVEAYVEFKDGGDTVDLPEPYDDILAVFKDNVTLVEGASFLGYTLTATGIQLSEPVNTNNQAGGETIRILWRPSSN